MALTRATKEKRLKSLDEDIAAAEHARRVHTRRAAAAEHRAAELQKERDWLAKAPVADPLPELHPELPEPAE